VALGTAKRSFVSLHLEEMEREGDSTNQQDLRRLKVSALHLYSAGAETTSSSLMVFILVMLLFPEAQQKAQHEIGQVVGKERLPSFEDRHSLPYLDALVQEVMRWHPVVPLGVPHLLTEDDIYRGYFIPGGSTIIANTRSMMKNRTVYQNPHEFRPERFLPKDAGGYGEPLSDSSFGFGRRICPGRYLADASIWIVAASILAAFDIVPIQDEMGKDVIPGIGFVTSLTSHPKPFKCNIRPRTAQARSLIENS